MLILLETTIVFFMITSVVTSDDKVPSLFYIMEFLECTINIPKYLRVWTACITAGLKYLLASNSRLMSSVLSSGSQFNSVQSPQYISVLMHTHVSENGWVFPVFSVFQWFTFLKLQVLLVASNNIAFVEVISVIWGEKKDNSLIFFPMLSVK